MLQSIDLANELLSLWLRFSWDKFSTSIYLPSITLYYRVRSFYIMKNTADTHVFLKMNKVFCNFSQGSLEIIYIV